MQYGSVRFLSTFLYEGAMNLHLLLCTCLYAYTLSGMFILVKLNTFIHNVLFKRLCVHFTTFALRNITEVQKQSYVVVTGDKSGWLTRMQANRVVQAQEEQSHHSEQWKPSPFSFISCRRHKQSSHNEEAISHNLVFIKTMFIYS